MKMHLLFFPNGFEKTECVGKKLKNIAPNLRIDASFKQKKLIKQ